jgi:hypothetical protein
MYINNVKIRRINKSLVAGVYEKCHYYTWNRGSAPKPPFFFYFSQKNYTTAVNTMSTQTHRHQLLTQLLYIHSGINRWLPVLFTPVAYTQLLYTHSGTIQHDTHNSNTYTHTAASFLQLRSSSGLITSSSSHICELVLNTLPSVQRIRCQSLGER